jgi:hypothetical protein
VRDPEVTALLGKIADVARGRMSGAGGIPGDQRIPLRGEVIVHVRGRACTQGGTSEKERDCL